MGTEESRAVSQEIGTTVDTDVIGSDTTERIAGEGFEYRRKSSRKYQGKSYNRHHPRRVANRKKAQAAAKKRRKAANRAKAGNRATRR